jgi:hypothetical protein
MGLPGLLRLNWVITNMSNTLHGHPFLLHTSILQEEDCPFKGSIKWTPFTRGNWSITNSLDEKYPFLIHAWDFSCVKMPQSGIVGVIGLTSAGKLSLGIANCFIVDEITACHDLQTWSVYSQRLLLMCCAHCGGALSERTLQSWRVLRTWSSSSFALSKQTICNFILQGYDLFLANEENSITKLPNTKESYPLITQKRLLKHSVCSKLGIKWLKWDEYTVNIEDNNSMKRGH